MKTVFVGGGAHRLLPIMRSALGRGAFNDGEIFLYDLDTDRAGAMAGVIKQTPEFMGTGCRVTFGQPLEKGLEGADMVCAVLMAGSRYTFEAGGHACVKYGFSGSDNVSLNGAFLALKGAPVIMGIARKMEKYCPSALFANFANPVAVLSGAVNNYTKIQCLGICQGYMNHMWDLSRLAGKDALSTDYRVKVAGINHFSFIVEGTHKKQDIHEFAKYHIKRENWKKVQWQKNTPPHVKRRMQSGMEYMVRLYREFDALLFSNEGDGITHVFYEDYIKDVRKGWKEKTASEIRQSVKNGQKARQAANMEFESMAKTSLGKAFWKTYPLENATFQRHDHDIISKLLRAVAGLSNEDIVYSAPNKGAVKGFADEITLEFSGKLRGKTIRPENNLQVPRSLYGLVASLASHQALLADAIGSDDPRTLHQALHAYPVKRGFSETRKLWKELLAINKNEISESLLKLKGYIE